MTFDLDVATRHALLRVLLLIDLQARAAAYRLDWMHAVGSGICYCGSDYENHSAQENHVPTEIPRDKGYYDDDPNNSV